MKYRLGEQGYMKGVISILIIGLIVFIGISFAKPYYRYYILNSYCEDHLMYEAGNTERIKVRVMSSARELKVPLLEENVTVTQYENTVVLRAHWSEVVDFFDIYQHQLNFKIDLEY